MLDSYFTSRTDEFAAREAHQCGWNSEPGTENREPHKSSSGRVISPRIAPLSRGSSVGSDLG